jgi:hypothetical protein
MDHWLLLLRNGEADPASRPDLDWQEMFDRFVAWTDELHRQGRLAVVARLDDDGGRTVRGALAVDGPFAEGKEAVVGLFVVRAADREEALAIARTAPHVADGGIVEVRRVGDFPFPLAS